MKKYLLFIISLCLAATAGAKTIEFRSNGVAINNGDTVTFKSEADPFDNLTCDTGDLALYNLTDQSISCTYVIKILKNTLNSDNSAQICMGTNCVPLSKDAFETYQAIGSATIDVNGKSKVSADATPTQTGIMILALTCTNGSENATVYIQFTNGDVSAINQVNAGEKHASVTASYSLSGQRMAKGQKGIAIVRMSNGENKKMVIE